MMCISKNSKDNNYYYIASYIYIIYIYFFTSCWMMIDYKYKLAANTMSLLIFTMPVIGERELGINWHHIPTPTPILYTCSTG